MMTILDHIQKDYTLKKLTTFGIGGPASYFIEVRQIEQMQQAILYCRQEKIPYFILGKGSNTLFDDKGFDGLVIANKIDFMEKIDPTKWHVGAGYSFSLLGSQTARQDLAGLEFASGIPGSVGGAVYMNAGANGHETCETLVGVDYITEEGDIVYLPRADLEFSYRFSSFQKMKGAIVGATFQLIPSPVARQQQLTIIDYRKKTQPYSAKSAGCIFRNPECRHAGALIDQSGLKGAAVGGAEVSTMHANFIINAASATCQDVLTLIDKIKETVKEKTGVELESEVRHIPYKPIADE